MILLFATGYGRDLRRLANPKHDRLRGVMATGVMIQKNYRRDRLALLLRDPSQGGERCRWLEQLLSHGKTWLRNSFVLAKWNTLESTRRFRPQMFQKRLVSV